MQAALAIFIALLFLGLVFVAVAWGLAWRLTSEHKRRGMGRRTSAGPGRRPFHCEFLLDGGNARLESGPGQHRPGGRATRQFQGLVLDVSHRDVPPGAYHRAAWRL